MNISDQLEIVSGFLSFYNQNQDFFKSFEHIYLFGSVLSDAPFPNDIDLLLVYPRFKNELLSDINRIKKQAKHFFYIPVDITVLSIAELDQTAFLSKIKHYYKIK